MFTFGLVGGGSTALGAGGNSVTSPDSSGNVGPYMSMALDASGHPIVSYYDQTNGDLKVMHCDDANCAGGGESFASPDTAGNVGLYSSLTLDGSGNPVISYYQSTTADLRVMHCNDPNCAGGNDSITSPDTGGDVGAFSSLKLDQSGFPVISYEQFIDDTNSHLKVIHCNDPNCAGADENVVTADGAGVVGGYSSLALDGSGHPVVSYNDWGNRDLKVLHCGDANCASGNSITSPDTSGFVGTHTSLQLDAAGRPLVAYHYETDRDVRLLHCGNPDCTSGNSIVTPDSSGEVGWSISLALDSGDRGDRGVISYYDIVNGDLRVLRCGNTDCSSVTNIVVADEAGDVGYFETSLALDGSGGPVVSYNDVTNGNLKLLHCNGSDCKGTKPTVSQINITNYSQMELPKTCFSVRNDIDNPLFNVCDNDFQGPPESHFACVPDGVCEDEDPQEGHVKVTVASNVYNVAESKSPPQHSGDAGITTCSSGSTCEVTFTNVPVVRPWHPWDITGPGGVPDGFVRVQDILEVVNHYFQDKPLP